MTTSLMTLRVERAEPAARGIQRFELRHPDGVELPPFTAGAHVRIKTPSGAMRQYSLSNDPAERDRYVIAVKREGDGRGGSLSLVDGVLLFILLWLFARKPRPTLAVSGVFALGYGCARFFTEYFRMPDYEVSFAGWTISAGQMLSLPMIAVGLILLILAYRKPKTV